MMPHIYGNERVLHLIRTMAERDRIPHACLIYGEQGLGRKTIARYLAMAALCTGGTPPCGTCSSCRKILNQIHPDVIWVPHSGKKNGFSVETVRSICKDAIVAPNDGEKKAYIFADCDNMDSRAQNTLLKLTEEPPPHVLLIFTTEHRNAFLETMLSRMMPLAVCPCSHEDCRSALLEQGRSAAEADNAISVCGGNIGRCLAWLDSDTMQEMTQHIAQLTYSIAERRQYEILRILSLYEKDRQNAAVLLRLLDMQFRDALVLKYGEADLVGCDRQSAQKLSQLLTVSRSREMHHAVQTAYEALQANVSTKLALAALGGSL
jgi:DNA polymerase-3 subunit delta'